MWLDSLSLQSQETRIHRATRYGSMTCSHFQVTMGKVVRFPPAWWPPLSPSSEFCVFPVPEPELDPWSLLDLMPCCVSTVSVEMLLSPLGRLTHLDTMSNMQRKSATCQVLAIFGKVLQKLSYWLKCPGQSQIVLKSLIPLFSDALKSFSLCPYICAHFGLAHFLVLLSVKDAAFYSRWSSAHPDASLLLSSYYFVPRPASLTTLLSGRFDCCRSLGLFHCEQVVKNVFKFYFKEIVSLL